MSEFDSSTDDDDKVIVIRPRNQRGQPPRQGQSRQDYGGWVKTKPSKQDQLNAHPEQIKEKLFDYERISSEKYATMDS